MIDINSVVLIGRLTRDADLKYTSGGTPVCKFSIAVNRSVKREGTWEDEANFFDIVLWGKQGESLNKYLLKGKQVAVLGELRQDRWQQDGQNRSKVEIIANSIQLLGGGNNEGKSTDSGKSGGAPSSGKPTGNDNGFTDDIPF